MTLIERLKASFNALYRPLDRRFGLTAFIERNFTQKMVPKGYCLLACFGGLSFVACLMQFLSGIILAFYYLPSEDEAFGSVQYIRHQVPLGWLVQKAHVVGTHLLVVLILIHMARIFYKGIFHKPRELHWISGCVLFLVTLLFAFTGSMLPNHLEHWQPEEHALANPVTAGWLESLWSENRLTIVYIFHVILLPLIMLVFLGVHFVMIRRTGCADPL